jgi:hypothetical protein
MRDRLRLLTATAASRSTSRDPQRDAYGCKGEPLCGVRFTRVLPAIALATAMIASACSDDPDSPAETGAKGAKANAAGPDGKTASPGGSGADGSSGASAANPSDNMAAGSSAAGMDTGAAGAAENSMAGADAPTPTVLGPDCDDDPLAGKEPFGSGFYQQFRGLFGCTAAADLELFRKLLPEKFEMPAEPQVCFYILDFQISSLGPYYESAIQLPAMYKGESAKYTLTMDVDSILALTAGRGVGFPKYMGQISLEQNGNDWVGTASANGEVDLKASYTGECNRSDEFMWPNPFTIVPIPADTPTDAAFLPPRTGSVNYFPAEYPTPPAYNSLKGSIRLEIRDDLPWNGLVDETKPFPGLMTWFIGGVGWSTIRLD